MALAHRQKRYLVAVTLTLMLAVALAAVEFFTIWRGHDWFAPGAWLILLPLFAAATTLTAVPSWRAADEMQREAGLISWYWGGLFGGLLGLMAVALVAQAHKEVAWGAIFVVLAQSASYFIFRFVHRFARRPAAA